MVRINCSNKINVVPGKVQSIDFSPTNGLNLHIMYNQQKIIRNYDYVIRSNGFDPYLFLMDLLDDDTKSTIMRKLDVQTICRNIIEQNILYDLSLNNISAKLFLPMLAPLAQGPGFSNLSCLGRLSDRILQTYC